MSEKLVEQQQLHQAGQVAKMAAWAGLFFWVNRQSQLGMTPAEKRADNRKTLKWTFILLAVVLLFFFGMVLLGSFVDSGNYN